MIDTQEVNNAETHYRRNMCYPFIDHHVMEFSQPFPDSSQSMFLDYKLLPNTVFSITTKTVEDMANYYGPDMPNKSNFQPELEMYKANILQLPQVKKNEITLLDALTVADRNFFHNVHRIFKLILT